jgi:hypothetical protein
MPKPTDPTDPQSPNHHVRTANRLLLIEARFGWSAFKLVAKTAIRIPRLFVHSNTRPQPHDLPDTPKKPV